jgi:hypothetical protein
MTQNKQSCPSIGTWIAISVIAISAAAISFSLAPAYSKQYQMERPRDSISSLVESFLLSPLPPKNLQISSEHPFFFFHQARRGRHVDAPQSSCSCCSLKSINFNPWP